MEARASARHGKSRAMLRALLLPLLLAPVGCRTIDDDDRYWRRSWHHGGNRHHHASPPPHVYRPSAPPVFVAPRPPPSLPPGPAYVQPRLPERRLGPQFHQPNHSGSGERGHRWGRDSRPDHKRGR